MITLDDLRLEQVPESLRELALAGQREADLSLAAAQLAELKHQSKTRPPKIFTGRVFDARRSWRGQRVVLPTGHIGVLHLARRGAAIVKWRDDFALRPERHLVLSTAELKPFKLAAAAILGRAKRGVRERPSLRKGQAARLNGAAPPRPGSRPRGRPRIVTVAAIAGSPTA